MNRHEVKNKQRDKKLAARRDAHMVVTNRSIMRLAELASAPAKKKGKR